MHKMLELIQKTVLLLELFLCAWIDNRERMVYVWLLLPAGLFGIGVQLCLGGLSVTEMVCATLPGVACLLLSLVTKGSIGAGDGMVLIMTGIFLGFWENLNLLVCSLMLSGILALFLLVLKKKRRNDRLPMLPFVLVAYVGMLV